MGQAADLVEIQEASDALDRVKDPKERVDVARGHRRVLGVHQDLIGGGESVLGLLEEVGEDRHGVGITHSGRGLTVARAQRGSLEGLPGGADELLGLAVDRRLGELDELDEALEVTGRRARSAVEERAGQSGSFGQRVGVIDASEQRPDCSGGCFEVRHGRPRYRPGRRTVERGRGAHAPQKCMSHARSRAGRVQSPGDAAIGLGIAQKMRPCRALSPGALVSDRDEGPEGFVPAQGRLSDRRCPRPCSSSGCSRSSQRGSDRRRSCAERRWPPRPRATWQAWSGRPWGGP